MKVRRVPRTLDAIQYDGTTPSAIQCDLRINPVSGRLYIDCNGCRQWPNVSDWILTDEMGNKHVIDAATFAKNYEEVDDPNWKHINAPNIVCPYCERIQPQHEGKMGIGKDVCTACGKTHTWYRSATSCGSGTIT